MDLLQHAMNVAGFGLKGLELCHVKPGFTVTKVDWRGCMATDCREEDVGDVVRYEARKISGSKDLHDGFIVRWDKQGERWEMFERFRKVGDELEVWS